MFEFQRHKTRSVMFAVTHGLLLFFTPIGISAQTIHLTESLSTEPLGVTTSDKSVGLMDADTVADSVYYDFQSRCLIIRLSSIDFEPLPFEWELGEGEAFSAGNGILTFWNSAMRTNNKFAYVFENTSGRFRLSDIREDYHGPDGYYSTSHDLLTNIYTINYYSYYDPGIDSLVSVAPPPIAKKIDNPPIYLGDDLQVNQPKLDSLKEETADINLDPQLMYGQKHKKKRNVSIGNR